MNEKSCVQAIILLMLLVSCQSKSKNPHQIEVPKIAKANNKSANINQEFLGLNIGRVSFDKGWKFNLGGYQGAEQKNLNDSSWRNVNLPHDWSIEDIKGTNSPFDPKATGQVSTGFTIGGTGWYRKTFFVPASSRGKKIFIQFEGVYMNSDVYINGQHLGNHPYGYTGFEYDLTRFINYGANNIIAIEVKNEGQNSRWYAGSGIYRHVWLRTTELVYIQNQGTQISTANADTKSANIHFKSSVINDADQVVSAKSIVRIVNKSGADKARWETSYDIQPHAKRDVYNEGDISNPDLWSVETPNLYKAIHEIYMNEKLVGSEETTFGIRTIVVSVDNGFQLNGKIRKLQGGCVHHDNGPLGAKAYDRAEERKVELLKKSGFNALRCSHNPPSPSFLDACDRLGMLVIDEAFDTWSNAKNPFDYHLYFKQWGVNDIENTVTRDRNHPSVIMWSSGNEIVESDSPEGTKTSLILLDAIRRLDSTRPITNAVAGLNKDKSAFFATLDVAGYNYSIGGEYKGQKIYEADHKKYPSRIMLGTESYAINAFENWMYVLDHPYVIGDFVWTAFDYIGEASIGWLGYPQSSSFYPWNLAFCGDLDICGFKRPQSYYRDALWMEGQLSVFVESPSPSYPSNPNLVDWSTWNWFDVWPDWTWKGQENKPMNVSVYSSCDEVELSLNGKSLGKKPTNKSTEYKAAWQVPYQAGTLKATGFKDGKPVNTSQLQTALQPTKIKLTTDKKEIRANGQDLSYITVELCDKNGVLNPKSDQQIKFTIQGEGTIEAVGNGDPTSIESFTAHHRKAWKGKCLVIVKAGEKPGNIVLTASSSSLPTQVLTIVAR